MARPRFVTVTLIGTYAGSAKPGPAVDFTDLPPKGELERQIRTKALRQRFAAAP